MKDSDTMNPGFTSRLSVVRFRKQKHFWLNVIKNLMSQVSADLFCMKTDHNFSLMLTKGYQFLNRAIKMLNNAVVTTCG